MRTRLAAVGRRSALAAKRASDAVAGAGAVGLLRLVRRLDPERAGELAARLMRQIGPWLPEHRTGRANLAAAFPEKSPAEIERILSDVWSNLGWTTAEYAHLDRLWDYQLGSPVPGRIEAAPETVERALKLANDGKPALLFAAHLANWELPAVAAAAHGLESAVLYRAPSVGDVAQAVNAIRSINMGKLVPSSPAAVFVLMRALQQGAHVGMLVDQHFTRGVHVTFFGRRCKANPTLARLARHIDCPIHGIRTIRLPNHRFRIEVTPEIVPARRADGTLDVAGTMQIITGVVEGWVREHPEQWLWLHRRWRDY
ncbi:MAG TPA: lipid A biosynthesis lauroyl acyltransferase [Xanthobacteraceae bacterium]